GVALVPVGGGEGGGVEGRLRLPPRPPLPPLRLCRTSRGRARPRGDGLGRRGGARDRGVARGPGREGRAREGPALPAVLRPRLRGGAAQDDEGGRGSRPLERARGDRAAALSPGGRRPPPTARGRPPLSLARSPPRPAPP